MTKPHVFSPSISTVLEEFFGGYQRGASVAVRTRIAAVRSDLERHLELEGPRILASGQLLILNTEKQFDPEGVFVRTMHADDLYYALQHYLDPVHALESTPLRDTQLDVVAALAESLWRRQLISEGTVSECTVMEFEIALTRGRDVVKAPRGRGPDSRD